MGFDIVRDEQEGDDYRWNLVWSSKTPPKVKSCVWRICKRYTPTRTQLFIRNVVEDKMCAWCGRECESDWHVFMGCEYARGSWQNSDFFAEIEDAIQRANDLPDLIFNLLQFLHVEKRELFMVILWRIWKERNSMVFTGRSVAVAMVQQLSRNYLVEWQEVRPNVLGVKSTNCCAWHPPVTRAVKINTDAALFGDTKEVGLGMVLHDAAGRFIQCRSTVNPGIFEPVKAEAMGVLETLSWVKHLGYNNVVIEMDVKIVHNALLDSEKRNNVFGDVINACKKILRESPTYKLSWIRRDANIVAHQIARNARSFPSPNCWVERPIHVDGLPNISCTCC
ncbi:hypothetical protein ACS0TY_028554 [Phlomoides rotata]